MKRLLCLISGMNAGGAETFLMKIYRQLDKTKYQMDFCVNTAKKCFYDKEIENMGGRFFRIPPKSQNVAQFTNALEELVSKEGYKYVLRITSNAAGFLDLKIAKHAGAKVCAARSSNSSDGAGWKVKLAHLAGRLLYEKYVDVKIAPSDLAAEYTFGKQAVRQGTVHFLHNAIDLDTYCFREEDRNTVRMELGIDDKLVFGHVGRFSNQKNHAFLLEIFSEIVKRHSNSVLVLVGEGEKEQEIHQKATVLNVENKVIFAGIRSDIPQLLSAMDVFVFPSFYEGMPNTVIEAQATGLPCVISDTITKEANITGLVEYLSLSSSAEQWAETALGKTSNQRKNTKRDILERQYDIASVTKQFVALMFGE